ILVKVNLAYAKSFDGYDQLAEEKIDEAIKLFNTLPTKKKYQSHLAYCQRVKGDILRRKGRIKTAEAVHIEAIESVTEIYEKDSLDMVPYQNALAWDQILHKRWSNARELLESSLDIIEKTTGKYDMRYSVGLLKFLACYLGDNSAYDSLKS